MEGGIKRLSRECLIRAGESLRKTRWSDKANLHSMISYPNYKYIFPMKALGMYGKKYGNPVMA